MSNASPLSTSSAKSGNPDAIAALINRSLSSKGISVTALAQNKVLKLYVTSTKKLDYSAVLKFIEDGICKLQPRALRTVNIFIQDAQTAQVLESIEFDVPATKDDEGSKIIHLSSHVNPPVLQENLSQKRTGIKRQELNTKTIVLIVSFALLGLTSAFTVGGVFWLRSSQASIISQAIESITSSSEGETDLGLMVQDRESLLNAKTSLESISGFPGSRYPQARQEIEIIEVNLKSLNERINAQSSQQKVASEQLANQVSETLKNTPVSVANLNSSRDQLEQAIQLLESIPSGTEVYTEAQAELAAYQGQVTQLNQKFTLEDQAASVYNQALNLAMEAAQLTQGSPHAASVWQQAVTKWQEAINTLKTIPGGTSISGTVQEKLTAYQGNLAAVQGRLNAEEKAVQDFETAKQLANQAVSLTQNPPHASSVWQESSQKWQQAINLLKGVPNGTTVYQEASGRIASYQGNLATINTNLQKQLAAEALERLRPQIQSVVDQFSALDSRLDVGMNYSSYSSDVRELKVALDQLGRQPGVRNLAVYQSLENAFKHYDVAKSIWQYYLESDETHSFLRASGPYGSLLRYTYGVPTQDILGTPYIYLDTALSKVWGHASNQVRNAQDQI